MNRIYPHLSALDLARVTLNQNLSPDASLRLSRDIGFSPTDALHQLARSVTYQPLILPCESRRPITCWIRRDDQIDRFESGNKPYKLFYNLQLAQQLGFSRVASFGGAWSNHLYALAAAGHRLGLKTYGLVRGAAAAPVSAMLQDVQAMGMQLHFCDRASYRQKILPQDFPQDCWLVPEGGDNLLGALGMHVVGRAVAERFGACNLCLPVGTGASLAGVASGLGSESRAFGFSVLKGEGDLGSQVRQKTQHLSELLGSQTAPWSLVHGYHGGGYGRKLPSYLADFLERVQLLNPRLLLDPVYTLKMLWGVNELLQNNYFCPELPLVIVHTGGLQGRRGFGLPEAAAIASGAGI